MTRERIAMWIVLGLIALTALFNNYLLHHIEDSDRRVAAHCAARVDPMIALRAE